MRSIVTAAIAALVFFATTLGATPRDLPESAAAQARDHSRSSPVAALLRERRLPPMPGRYEGAAPVWREERVVAVPEPGRLGLLLMALFGVAGIAAWNGRPSGFSVRRWL